jgi:hypothetical protein
MTKRILTAMLLAATLTACLTSPSTTTAVREDNQRGTIGGVRMNNGTEHYGELLALDDSSVVLLTNNRVAVGALSHVVRLTFDDLDVRDVAVNHGLQWSELRKGQELSRFPYGITPSAMSLLLANAKQKTLDRLEIMAP